MKETNTEALFIFSRVQTTVDWPYQSTSTRFCILRGKNRKISRGGEEKSRDKVRFSYHYGAHNIVAWPDFWSPNYTVQERTKRDKNIALYTSKHNKHNFVTSNQLLPRRAKNEENSHQMIA